MGGVQPTTLWGCECVCVCVGTTTQINKKIYCDVLAFENASLNRIFTRAIHTHTGTDPIHTTSITPPQLRRQKRRRQTFKRALKILG